MKKEYEKIIDKHLPWFENRTAKNWDAEILLREFAYDIFKLTEAESEGQVEAVVMRKICVYCMNKDNFYEGNKDAKRIASVLMKEKTIPRVDEKIWLHEKHTNDTYSMEFNVDSVTYEIECDNIFSVALWLTEI